MPAGIHDALFGGLPGWPLPVDAVLGNASDASAGYIVVPAILGGE